jgi:putative ABC transport system permease protein
MVANSIMLKLAVRNVFRQKLRTVMTLSAIVLGVVALILSGGFVQDVYRQLGESLIHSQSGHMQLSRAGFQEHGARSPEKFLIDRPEPLIQHITSIREVNDVMARINFSGLLSNARNNWPVIGEGVIADKEAALGTHLQFVRGRTLEKGDLYSVVLGEGIAQALNLAPGDRATLLVTTAEGALNTLELEVVGVFQSFSKDYDARAMRIPLAAAQELMGTNGVNSIVVSLNRTDDTVSVARELRKDFDSVQLEIHTWRQLNDFYENTVALYERQFGVLQFIILVMVLLSVANSVNMGVLERVGEFGTMMALGDRSISVVRLVLAENVVLGVCGATAGVIVGVVVAAVISAIGIPMPPPPNANRGYTAHILIFISTLLTAFSLGVSATVLAALMPARRVSRIQVVEALRQNL